MQDFAQLLKDLEEDVKDAVPGHSEFQIRNFIIGSCPTQYGRYKQCILELRSRMKNYANLTKIQTDLQGGSDPEKASKLSECELLIEDLKRETYILSGILQELKEGLDLTKKDELEAEYWDVKFHKDLVLHLQLGGLPIPIGLAQNIMSLPSGSPARQQLDSVIAQMHELSVRQTKRLE